MRISDWSSDVCSSDLNVSSNPHLLPLHLRHQAWFIGYAPAQDPEIAVAVMVEQGGYGGSPAAPIARKLFDAWLLGEYAEPDPRSEEHTYGIQSLMRNSYAVFCLQKPQTKRKKTHHKTKT